MNGFEKWIIKILNIKMYDTYNKVSHVFKKPKLYWRFGSWRKDPCLPVWRRGPYIKLIKYNYNDVTWGVVGKSKPKRYKIGGKWTWSSPTDIKGYMWSEDYKKRHPIISKLFKPNYQLPIWLSFYVFNHDMIWKTKWDDYRFEFPPQYTIVLFGYSLSFWLRNPIGSSRDDLYWESMLWYIDKNNLKDAFNECTVWMDMGSKEYIFPFNPAQLKEPYSSEAQVMVDNYKKTHNINEDIDIW